MSVVSKHAIGILAIQGDYDAHALKLKSLGVESILVKYPEQLYGLKGLIIPGGESTTLLKFLNQYGFDVAIKKFHANGGVIFGTCAGAILLASSVEPAQQSLQLMSTHVARNAYGRQLSSAIEQGQYLDDGQSCECVFIRAPKIANTSGNCETIVECNGEAVCVLENRCMVATFHPELSRETKLHERFIAMCNS